MPGWRWIGTEVNSYLCECVQVGVGLRGGACFSVNSKALKWLNLMLPNTVTACVSTCAKQPLSGNGSTHLLAASGPITQTTLGEALLWLEGWLIGLLWLALPDDLTVCHSVCLSSISGPASTASSDWWCCWAKQQMETLSSLTASCLVPLCQPQTQVVTLIKELLQ